jgi:hypothetical protein
MYKRRSARYAVHFQSTLSTAQVPESSGTALDLSIRGCHIQSFIPVIPGLLIKLSILASESEAVIEIDQAIVRWTANQEFGLEFTAITPEQFERLTKLVQQLPAVSHRS